MNETHQVVRTLKLADSSAQQHATQILCAIEGVASIEAQKQQLRITYDFTKLSWSTVCEALIKAGHYSQKGLIARWRDSWRDLLDHNMRENLSQKAACCSKPPSGAGRK